MRDAAHARLTRGSLGNPCSRCYKRHVEIRLLGPLEVRDGDRVVAAAAPPAACPARRARAAGGRGRLDRPARRRPVGRACACIGDRVAPEHDLVAPEDPRARRPGHAGARVPARARARERRRAPLRAPARRRARRGGGGACPAPERGARALARSRRSPISTRSSSPGWRRRGWTSCASPHSRSGSTPSSRSAGTPRSSASSRPWSRRIRSASACAAS